MDRLGIKHQPLGYYYPKRKFGQTRVVSRSFQAKWYKDWPWLHYVTETDSVLCYTCATAVQQSKLSSSATCRMDEAFVSRGFSNWKNPTISFKKHECSDCHRNATEVMIKFPAQVGDIGEQLSTRYKEEKAENRDKLLKILGNTRFLARQGLAFRGSGDDENSNFIQLLRLRGDDDDRISQWMKKNINKYISPQAQNELIQIMALSVLRDIVKQVQSTSFITVMIDETADISNREQVVIVLRWVAENLDVYEDFIGLYAVDNIQASTLYAVVKDTFARLNIPINKVRGQCYDGASAMTGCRKGLVKLIKEEERRALFIHCYGHSLNLAANDAVKKSALMKSALEVTHEITKLVKFSPRRDTIFEKIKKEIAPDCIGIRVLCPTRWTVRAQALSSILLNYEVLIKCWEEARSVIHDTETIGRINGVASYMEKFSFLFGIVIGELILGHADNLSKSLQLSTLTAAEGQRQANLTVMTLESIRSESMFDLLWDRVVQLAHKLEVDSPTLPRHRKKPKRYGEDHTHFPDSAKEYYRQSFYEALDLITGSIKDRFNQSDFHIYRKLQSIIIKAARGEDFHDEFSSVTSFYGSDVNSSRLKIQLEILTSQFSNVPSSSIDFHTVLDFLKTLQNHEYLSEVISLVN